MATTPNPAADRAEMLAAYRQNPTTEKRNRIAKENLGLVRKIAHCISNQCAEPYEDLEQIGFLGLIRAIERFDPDQGCAFSSFAVPYIRGEMLHYLRDRGTIVRVPRRWQDLKSKALKLAPRLHSALGRIPGEVEIAQALGVGLEEWRSAVDSSYIYKPFSLDAKITDGFSELSRGDAIPDLAYQEWQAQEEDKAMLQQALAALTDRERTAIELVFFDGLSRKEAAIKLGLSVSQFCRQIESICQKMARQLEVMAQ